MRKRSTATLLLLAYTIVLIIVMVFKNVPTIHLGPVRLNFGGTSEGPVNLVPFKTIWPYLLGKKGLLIGGLNILGNIVLLIPIGLLVPFLYRMNWKKVLVLALASGLVIEGLQLLLRVGRFDIDDVILNGIGVMVGYWLFLLVTKVDGSVNTKNLLIVTGFVFVLTTCGVFYLFSGPRDNGQRHAPGITAGADPCNGTGGLGPIVDIGNHRIRIKRNDGVIETINLGADTKIMNSEGPVAESFLKKGDRVTVVVMSKDKTANAVMICSTTGK